MYSDNYGNKGGHGNGKIPLSSKVISGGHNKMVGSTANTTNTSNVSNVTSDTKPDTSNNPDTNINPQVKTKVTYSLDLNTYDKGYKPYYPSMDTNAMGGVVKSNKSGNSYNAPGNIYSKKRIKGNERDRSTYSASNTSNNTLKNNSLSFLKQAYGDDK